MGVDRSIFCDRCGKTGASASVLNIARSIARAAGWISTGQVDLCPSCQTGHSDHSKGID